MLCVGIRLEKHCCLAFLGAAAFAGVAAAAGFAGAATALAACCLLWLRLCAAGRGAIMYVAVACCKWCKHVARCGDAGARAARRSPWLHVACCVSRWHVARRAGVLHVWVTRCVSFVMPRIGSWLVVSRGCGMSGWHVACRGDMLHVVQTCCMLWRGYTAASCAQVARC